MMVDHRLLGGVQAAIGGCNALDRAQGLAVECRQHQDPAARGAARIEFGTYRFTLDEIPDTVAELTTKYGLGAA